MTPWNALKLLNEKGEFISAEDGQLVLEIAEKEAFNYVDVNHLKTKIIRTAESARNVPNNWNRVGILARNTALKIVQKTAWVCKRALVGPPRPLTQSYEPIRPVNVINVPAIKLILKLYQ